MAYRTTNPMKCPHCSKTITASTIAKYLASRTSPAKAKASAENGKLGGRPKKPQDGMIDALKEADLAIQRLHRTFEKTTTGTVAQANIRTVLARQGTERKS